MTDKTTSIFPATRFMRHISLSKLLPFFRKKKAAQAYYLQIASSIFSQPDQMELLAQEEEICPLIEAEVYVIYGRTADAEHAIDAGVKSGRITAMEAAQFWSNQGNASGQTNSD